MDGRERLRAARQRVSQLEHELVQAHLAVDVIERDMRAWSSAVLVRADQHVDAGAPTISAASSPREKVAFFRARFAGRDDVYASPWVSRRTGKKGWSPAVRGGYYTDAITDADLLPLTDAVIENHLRGGSARSHVGLYPLGADDQCRLLVCDFDDGPWCDDAAAYVSACKRAGIDTLAEISRSGEGAHVWVFFEDAVLAASARAMDASLLRSGMGERATISMSSYDRFFPSQDVLPQRSPGQMRFGNLIELPLHGDHRRSGTTVFADPNGWPPFEDQFAALAGVVPVRAEQLDGFASSSKRLPAGPRDSVSVRPRRAEIRA